MDLKPLKSFHVPPLNAPLHDNLTLLLGLLWTLSLKLALKLQVHWVQSASETILVSSNEAIPNLKLFWMEVKTNILADNAVASCRRQVIGRNQDERKDLSDMNTPLLPQHRFSVAAILKRVVGVFHSIHSNKSRMFWHHLRCWVCADSKREKVNP